VKLKERGKDTLMRRQRGQKTKTIADESEEVVVVEGALWLLRVIQNWGRCRRRGVKG
jgi:hypothetical protein